MKIIICGENVIENYLPVDTSDSRFWFRYCLPTNSEGKYVVSVDGIEFIYVDESNLWEYPYVKINKNINLEYTGISNQGISLLAFELESFNVEEDDIEIGVYPSFVCVFDDRIQIIFRLKDFIPKFAKSSTWHYLEFIIEEVGEHLSGALTDIVINPYCNKVKSYIFNYEGVTLGDIRNATPGGVDTGLSLEEWREHVHSVRAKGGRMAAKVKSDKSIDIILRTVRSLQEEGKPYNQTLVSTMCGRSRRVVNKHWPEVMSLIGIKAKP